MSDERRIWTVGTGHRSLEELIQLLEEHRVVHLVDVRSYPRSHLDHYCREQLDRELPQREMAYLWLGAELGGLRRQGYEEHTTTELFAAGLATLEATATRRPTAFFCAEVDPERCHRRFIADALLARGWRVTHILGPGRARDHVVVPRQASLPMEM